MVKSIQIDDDVYEYLVSNTQQIGETASEILRRLLDLNSKPTGVSNNSENPHELSQALNEPEARVGTFTDRFLFLLGKIHELRTDSFHQVVKIKGRARRYFAKSAREIEESGTNTFPRQIPNSGYWVMTNASNRTKLSMVLEVLSLLDFSDDAEAGVRRLLQP